MKKIIYILFLPLILAACGGGEENGNGNGGNGGGGNGNGGGTEPIVITNFDEWLAAPADQRDPITDYDFAQEPISKADAAKVTEGLYSVWKTESKKDFAKEWRNKIVLDGNLRMPYEYRTYGRPPADGRSLYISLHGGGNVPSNINDEQWRNQIMLYAPAEGIYVAPRAPWDDWDMWFKPGIDVLFDRLIQMMTINEEVNPNKVYLLGYSAGGDGLYRMGPRMADRWAAASMMAGHPGNASMLNLRNTPYMIWMGEHDDAYDRNSEAIRYGKILDSLQNADPGGYIHETHIVSGKGHWMDEEDARALPWMAQYERNPYPEKIVWRQEEVVLPTFYWLAVNQTDAKHGMEVRVERSGNIINITKNQYPSLTIFLNDEIVNLDEPVIIQYEGREIFSGTLERTITGIYENMQRRGDPNYAFPVWLTVKDNAAVE